MADFLDKLEEITGRLPEVKTLKELVFSEGNGFSTYTLEKGIFLSRSIYHDQDIALAKAHFPLGGKLQNHYHPGSYEIIIVLSGELLLNLDGEEIILKKHDSIRIEKGLQHSTVAKEDTVIIVATVPSDGGFPREKRNVHLE